MSSAAEGMPHAVGRISRFGWLRTTVPCQASVRGNRPKSCGPRPAPRPLLACPPASCTPDERLPTATCGFGDADLDLESGPPLNWVPIDTRGASTELGRTRAPGVDARTAGAAVRVVHDNVSVGVNPGGRRGVHLAPAVGRRPAGAIDDARAVGRPADVLRVRRRPSLWLGGCLRGRVLGGPGAGVPRLEHRRPTSLRTKPARAELADIRRVADLLRRRRRPGRAEAQALPQGGTGRAAGRGDDQAGLPVPHPAARDLDAGVAGTAA